MEIYVKNVERVAARLGLSPDTIRDVSPDSPQAPQELREVAAAIPAELGGMGPAEVAALNRKLGLRVTVQVETDPYSFHEICQEGIAPDNEGFQKALAGEIPAEVWSERHERVEACCEDADLVVVYQAY